MAIAKASRVRGRLDGVVYKQYAGKVVITKVPDMSNIIPSKEQKGRRNLFKQAVAYAKVINNDPELKASYLKKVKKRGDTVFKYAMREFMKQQAIDGGKNAKNTINFESYTDHKFIYDAYKRIIKKVIETKTSKEEAAAEISALDKELLREFRDIRKESIKRKDWNTKK